MLAIYTHASSAYMIPYSVKVNATSHLSVMLV